MGSPSFCFAIRIAALTLAGLALSGCAANAARQAPEQAPVVGSEGTRENPYWNVQAAAHRIVAQIAGATADVTEYRQEAGPVLVVSGTPAVPEQLHKAASDALARQGLRQSGNGDWLRTVIVTQDQFQLADYEPAARSRLGPANLLLALDRQPVTERISLVRAAVLTLKPMEAADGARYWAGEVLPGTTARVYVVNDPEWTFARTVSEDSTSAPAPRPVVHEARAPAPDRMESVRREPVSHRVTMVTSSSLLEVCCRDFPETLRRRVSPALETAPGVSFVQRLPADRREVCYGVDYRGPAGGLAQWLSGKLQVAGTRPFQVRESAPGRMDLLFDGGFD